MAREKIAGLLKDAKGSLEGEHTKLRGEVESGLDGIKKKALSGS